DTNPSAGIVVEAVVDLAPTDAARNAFAHPTQAPAGARSGARDNAAPNEAVAPKTTITATIDADNTSIADCQGPVTDGGYNLVSDDSCPKDAIGTIQSSNAKLG